MTILQYWNATYARNIYISIIFTISIPNPEQEKKNQPSLLSQEGSLILHEHW